MNLVRFGFLAIHCLLIVVTSKAAVAHPLDDDQPLLTEKRFFEDALTDARKHYPQVQHVPIADSQFAVYQAYAVDLDREGEDEYVVSGEITACGVNVVLAYCLGEDGWSCTALNRSLGGAIESVQLLDINNDNRTEVFTLLHDEDMSRRCLIYGFSRTDSARFEELFRYETGGGWSSSHNIMLTQASSREYYRLRIDEILYPDSDEGSVTQNTYFYRLDNGKFVLDSTTHVGADKLPE
jgi:hypothetical protein